LKELWLVEKDDVAKHIIETTQVMAEGYRDAITVWSTEAERDKAAACATASLLFLIEHQRRGFRSLRRRRMQSCGLHRRSNSSGQTERSESRLERGPRYSQPVRGPSVRFSDPV
jgi:hypothetical protein